VKQYNMGDLPEPSPNTAVTQRSLPCPLCQHPGPHIRTAGKGPHHAALRCGGCQRFLKWLPKPRSLEVEAELGPSSATEAERRRQLTTWSDVAHRWTAQSTHRQEGCS
jgi:hypothetical protein